jgi:glycosyltransferase involved in cell wall biosynthesis
MVGIKKPFLPWIEEKHPFYDIENLTVIYSYCPHEILFESYNQAQVFVQASITEGMPNTLCEAMLCECTPVGSNVNGIPDAIGTTGIIIKKRDVAELETGVRMALSLNSGKEAARRIRENFALDDREKKMIRVLREEFFPDLNI